MPRVNRAEIFADDEVQVFHLVNRCVRRTYLCGRDDITGRDYSHRKQWIRDRLEVLAGIFGVEVLSFAVMSNHLHVVARTRPDIVKQWSDEEVALRWWNLFPQRRRKDKSPEEPTEFELNHIRNDVSGMKEKRKRLSNVSWFMKCLAEPIARLGNKEEKVTGHFWEGRFKAQPLLDETAIAACMMYVDLNPIRAGIAETPEDSDFTGIQQRIRIWRQKASSDPLSLCIPDKSRAGASESLSSSWLCPISAEGDSRGILPMSEEEYFILVDKSGRILRSDKRGAMDADLAPILERIGAKPEAWSDTVSCFEDKFRLAAGLLENLRKFADQLGKRWFTGLSASRGVFES